MPFSFTYVLYFLKRLNGNNSSNLIQETLYWNRKFFVVAIFIILKEYIEDNAYIVIQQVVAIRIYSLYETFIINFSPSVAVTHRVVKFYPIPIGYYPHIVL